MHTSRTPQPLWDFALAFYAQPQVAEACLQLQDEYQANVCLLIGLRWLDVRGQYLSGADFATLKIHIQDWARGVVEPLRSLRRDLKLPFANFVQDEIQTQLRTLIKQAELLAEKKLLIEIERWAIALSPISKMEPVNNLARYLIELNVPHVLIECLQGSYIDVEGKACEPN